MAKVLEKKFWTPLSKLMGLKSFGSEAPGFFGISTMKELFNEARCCSLLLKTASKSGAKTEKNCL
jgi:hypothetical protein